MAKFTIYNTNLADEPVETVNGRDGGEYYNAGAETGPYPVKTKFNNVAVPLPRTNLKVVLVPGAKTTLAEGEENPAGSFFEVETTDLVETEFFRIMRDTKSIPGIAIVETPANDETTGGEG